MQEIHISVSEIIAVLVLFCKTAYSLSKSFFLCTRLSYLPGTQVVRLCAIRNRRREQRRTFPTRGTSDSQIDLVPHHIISFTQHYE